MHSKNLQPVYRMLIVDDSNIIRRKIERGLHSGKIQVIATASSGFDAIQKAILHQPNIVTMDITMPHMDGIECIGELITRYSDIKILVISALADKATGIEALEKGARGFLCKPFTDQQLNDALLELIEE